MTARGNLGLLGALTTPGPLKPLDGLRAVAILLVLSTHIAQHIPSLTFALGPIGWTRPLNNGWIGVDLFFVLSGFLVGGAVLRSIADDRLSFRRFYLRRFFRIIPAYFAVILALGVLCFGWPGIEGIPDFTLAQVIPNVLLLTDYWPGDIGVPSWSLSIEEHFYLLIPLLLLFARKFPPATQRNLLLGVVFLALFSRMLTYLLYDLGGTVPGAEILSLIYFPFHNRMDALAMGVLVALVHQESPEGVPGSLRSVAGALGLLLAGFVYLSGAMYGRWGATTLQYSILAIGFGAVLWSVLPAQPVTWLARFLSARCWVPIARLSYSIYLTHLVVLNLADRVMPGPALAPLFMLACCLGAALPLFLLVEEPLHRYGRRAFP
jgi:peptidoglycan/LPS O-acetylase OafA/YrhL